MKFVRTLLFVFAILLFGKTQAQDLHWTMFDMSPLTLNPAFTGDFEGTFRVGGIYRSQWNSVSDATGFETPSFYVDAPILVIGKRNWLSVGGMLYNDKAGRLAQQRTAFMGSAAIHLGLNKKSTSVLSIGLQGGTVNQSHDLGDAMFPDMVADATLALQDSDGFTFAGGMEPSNNYLDFSAGVKFSSQLNKTADLVLGLSFAHVNTPKNSVSGTNQNDTKIDRALTTSFHGKFNTDLNEKFRLSPAFIYQTTSGANEIALQALVGYRAKKDLTIYLGPGYRMVSNDAIMAILKADYKQFRVGVAYDFNVSDLSAVSNGQGGFEIAASYIARIFKKPTVKPVIFCPRF